MDRHKLDGLTREELVSLASELGIVRPRSLTVPELIDEIVSRTASNERDKVRSRGWLGRARSLLASVIERGLHLPEVARVLRDTPASRPWPSAPPPLATMTLAEIYAAQGHLDKAIQVLDEILVREPEHADARSLRQRLDAQLSARKRPEVAPKRRDSAEDTPAPREPEVEMDTKETQTAVDAMKPREDQSDVPLTFVSTDVATANVVESPQVEVSTAQASDPVEQPRVEQPEAATAPVPESDDLPSVAPEVVERFAAPTVTESVESIERMEADDASELERPNIEELPLPERYNVDEIVGIAVDPSTVYLYWEVRPVVLARANARMPEGVLVVRLVCVTPTWDGPVVEQRDLPIDALYGDAYIRNLRPGSNVRIGVGWLSHGVFAPFAIGDAVSTPRKEPSVAVASTTATWTPDIAIPSTESVATNEETVAQLLDLASRPPVDASSAQPVSFTFERGADRWPTFDLGRRGLSTKDQQRPRVGGSSDLSRGGASDLVHPDLRTTG